jgi:hypothetical protein
MFRLDYLSCALTILSTVLVGRRYWHGWLIAGVNSVVVCYIGYRTAQTGFIPANVFCLAIYAYNICQWRNKPVLQQPLPSSATLEQHAAPTNAPRRTARANRLQAAVYDRPVRRRYRIRPHSLPHR